jgi:hypothetical protein
MVPEKTCKEVAENRVLLQGFAKSLVDRLYGPGGPGWGTRLSHLEHTADLLASFFQKTLLDLALARQAAAFSANPPESSCLCPSCHRDTLPREPEPRILQSHHGDVEWLEPQRFCPKCRKAFFPQSQSLGIDQGNYSVSLLELITYAAANKTSFREASLDLCKLGHVTVPEKQVERISKRIGDERVAQRDAQVAAFLELPLIERCDSVPQGVMPPTDDQVAVVMADAGMLQLRSVPDEDASADEPGPCLDTSPGAPGNDANGGAPAGAATTTATPGTGEQAATPAPAASSGAGVAANQEEEDDDPDDEAKPSGRHWREDKVGLAMTMSSQTHESDPHPEVPETFLDPKRVAKIVRGMKKTASLTQDEQDEEEASESENAAQTEEQSAEGTKNVEEASDEKPQEGTEKGEKYKGPKVEKKHVVASRQSWPLFGALLASAAWLMGLAKAKRKAFVADGAKAIWRVWKAKFSSYVPILDFIHVMSYVYAAAKAVGDGPVSGWKLYAEWIEWVWQGKVSRLIARLQKWQEENGKPEKGEAETSARRVVAKTLGYLWNNQDKMKYDEYRKEGLPIVSSLMESMVKQISRRVKGTEKFWTDEGAEAILQLRADYLSHGEVMDRFWEHRQSAATGQRPYRRNL